MRYLAQRVLTGEWLHRDLELTDVERTRELSGPGGISGSVDPELRQTLASDGLRIIEDWATVVYAADDTTGAIVNTGLVVPPLAYEDAATKLTAVGYTSYPHGYYYDDSRNWGAQVDPIKIVRDHWEWIQGRTDSNLGVTLVGSSASPVRIGDNAEPYRLRWWESPDLGQEIDSLADQTPFDYVEEHQWTSDAQTTVAHRVRLGYPRLGKRRDDLRFAEGENIALTFTADTSEEYANDVIGIGNGEGRTMIRGRSTISDGRLRRTKILTDKTIKSQARMDMKVRQHRERLSQTLDVTSVAIIDHPNAPISAIDLGDDILIQGSVPAYGDIRLLVRVLAISQGADPHTAVLTTQRSSAFIYSSTEEVA